MHKHVPANRKKSKNKDDSLVEYFQLPQNECHSVTRKPVVKIIHNFGRSDEVDREELVQLCRSIAKAAQLTAIDPSDGNQATPGTRADLSGNLSLISNLDQCNRGW